MKMVGIVSSIDSQVELVEQTIRRNIEVDPDFYVDPDRRYIERDLNLLADSAQHYQPSRVKRNIISGEIISDVRMAAKYVTTDPTLLFRGVPPVDEDSVHFKNGVPK